jgi:hypothetical protein
MTTCRLCKREAPASSSLCDYHLTAKSNVETGYEQWNRAFGGITWKEYLQRLQQSAETGQWAREVAELMFRESIG